MIKTDKEEKIERYLKEVLRCYWSLGGLFALVLLSLFFGVEFGEMGFIFIVLAVVWLYQMYLVFLKSKEQIKKLKEVIEDV